MTTRRRGRPIGKSITAAEGIKRSHYKVDQLTEALMEYIQRAYSEAYGLPHVSQSVIVRRALYGLAILLPAMLDLGCKDKEKKAVYSFARNRLSPFGLEGFPVDIKDNHGKLKSFMKLAREAQSMRNSLLNELKIGEPTNG